MKIVVQIEAPMEEVQAVKELLAMKLEGVGKVRIVEIIDDVFAKQMQIGK